MGVIISILPSDGLIKTSVGVLKKKECTVHMLDGYLHKLLLSPTFWSMSASERKVILDPKV